MVLQLVKLKQRKVKFGLDQFSSAKILLEEKMEFLSCVKDFFKIKSLLLWVTLDLSAKRS